MQAQNRDARSPETRLLNTARQLFCRDGIHATGIARVLSEANVARRTLYERFGSKENLLRAVFEREADMWFYWFDVVLPNRFTQPVERILGLFDLLRDWFASDEFYGCIFINAVAEHDKTSSWVRGLAEAHLAKVHGRIMHLTTAAGVNDPAITADQISMLIDGAIVTAMMTRRASAALIAQRTARDILAHTIS
jgi:AcrR family transcriptional regulator